MLSFFYKLLATVYLLIKSPSYAGGLPKGVITPNYRQALMRH